MEKLKQHLSFILSDPNVASDQIFDLLWLKLEDEYSSRKNNTIKDINASKAINKEKGTLFEDLCTELIQGGHLLKSYNVKSVYKFSDLPDQSKIDLGITTPAGKPTRKDMGIDIFAYCESGDWLAIQCKYLKKPVKQKYTPAGYKVPWVVPCDSLSSFYDICGRTGPKEKNNSWLRNVVITNSMGVRRRAKKVEKDLSICHDTFKGLSRDVWASICGYKANKLSDSQITPKDVKNARNSFLDRLVKETNEKNK